MMKPVPRIHPETWLQQQRDEGSHRFFCVLDVVRGVYGLAYGDDEVSNVRFLLAHGVERGLLEFHDEDGGLVSVRVYRYPRSYQ